MADNSIFIAISSVLKAFNIAPAEDSNGVDIPVTAAFKSGFISCVRALFFARLPNFDFCSAIRSHSAARLRRGRGRHRRLSRIQWTIEAESDTQRWTHIILEGRLCVPRPAYSRIYAVFYINPINDHGPSYSSRLHAGLSIILESLIRTVVPIQERALSLYLENCSRGSCRNWKEQVHHISLYFSAQSMLHTLHPKNGSQKQEKDISNKQGNVKVETVEGSRQDSLKNLVAHVESRTMRNLRCITMLV